MFGTPKSTPTDMQWNQYAYESLVEAKEGIGLEGTYVRLPYSEDMAASILRDHAEKGYELLFVMHGGHAKPMNDVADEYPDTFFSIAGGPRPIKVKPLPNLCIVERSWQEASYLLGILAGSITESNKVGVISGDPRPEFQAWGDAARMGVGKVNPNAEVLEDFTGAMEDYWMGKVIALSLIDKGVDVITGGATVDGAIFGTIAACKERGVYEWAFVDQHLLAPTLIFTSVILRVPVGQILEDIEAGAFKQIYWQNLANGGIKLAPYYGFETIIPQSAKDLVEKEKARIVSGELTLKGYPLDEGG